MKTLLLAGAAMIATAGLSTAANAQDMGDMAEDAATAVALTAAQQTMYDGWPMDRRTMYDGWPADVQTYYWTLPADRQNAYWMLNDEQRLQVYNLEPAQRTAAWTSIMAQVNGTEMPAANASTTGMANSSASTAPNASTTGTAMASTNARMNSGGMVQQVPAAQTGEYPPCRGDVQDSCVNPREAGLNYGNRPLDYWPGRPASEIDGPMPANRPSN